MSTSEKRAVLIFCQRPDGAVLSAWNRTYKVWGLPSGKVEEGEHLLQACMREVREELGVYTVPLDWGHSERMGTTIEVIDVSPTYSGSGRTCYTIRAPRFFRDIQPRAVELNTGVAWMTREFLCDQGIPTWTGCQVEEWFKRFFARLYDPGPKVCVVAP